MAAKRQEGELPRLNSVIHRLLQQVDGGASDIERVEVRLLESGECPYRVYRRGQDESEGGVITA